MKKLKNAVFIQLYEYIRYQSYLNDKIRHIFLKSKENVVSCLLVMVDKEVEIEDEVYLQFIKSKGVTLTQIKYLIKKLNQVEF